MGLDLDLDFQLLIDVYLIQRYRAGPYCLPTPSLLLSPLTSLPTRYLVAMSCQLCPSILVLVLVLVLILILTHSLWRSLSQSLFSPKDYRQSYLGLHSIYNQLIRTSFPSFSLSLTFVLASPPPHSISISISISTQTCITTFPRPLRIDASILTLLIFRYSEIPSWPQRLPLFL